jgi:hypothetical protein
VYDSAGRLRGDYLRDVGQPGEGARETDPLQVGAELRLTRGVRTVLLCSRSGQPGIHVWHATEGLSSVASVGYRAPAVLRRREGTSFSSLSDDEVGGSKARDARAALINGPWYQPTMEGKAR